MKKHRWTAVLLASMLFMMALTGCGSSRTPSGKEEGRLLIVTTIFPVYDWTKEILGERASDAELVCLLANGADYHSYQPSASDLVRMAEADLFLYVGGPSEEWAEKAIRNRTNTAQKTVCLFDVLSARVLEEETAEGMQEEEEHKEEGPEYDEHLWLSLLNAEEAVKAIRAALKEADQAHSETYETNAAAYLEKLAALDQAFRETVRTGRRDTVLFADRFPFRYLTEDYGLHYYAAFKGCSADTEASFATIVFLADKLKELSLPAVLTLEKSDHRLAETVISASGRTDAEVLTMDSMQAVTPADRAAGASYISIMEKNLEALKKALN